MSVHVAESLVLYVNDYTQFSSEDRALWHSRFETYILERPFHFYRLVVMTNCTRWVCYTHPSDLHADMWSFQISLLETIQLSFHFEISHEIISWMMKLSPSPTQQLTRVTTKMIWTPISAAMLVAQDLIENEIRKVEVQNSTVGNVWWAEWRDSYKWNGKI